MTTLISLYEENTVSVQLSEFANMTQLRAQILHQLNQ
jgi:hypothetical protein